MRWPWERVPWGRTRAVADPSSVAGDTATAGGSASPAPTDPGPSDTGSSDTGLPAAWTRLPPVQRSVADSTAVAPPAAFRASLTTHQNPSLLAPLGHLVDPDGPAGVVGGLASSVGGPIPYEGVDELRVPARPAEPTAPAVQRRIATLQSTAVPAPEAPQRTSETAELLPEAPLVVSAPVDATDTATPDAPPTPVTPSPMTPTPMMPTSMVTPSVVQRSVSDPTPLTTAAREVSRIATPDQARIPDGPPASSSSANRSDPPPLTVPVQRAVPSPADVPPRTAVPSQPVPSRPVVPSQIAVPVQRADASRPGAAPELAQPIGQTTPSTLRPEAPPATPPAATSAGDDVVGLVADRSPLLPSPSPVSLSSPVSPASSGSPSSSGSSSSSDGTTPPSTGTDLAAPLTVATSAAATPPVPAVQRLGVAPRLADQRSADVIPTGIPPQAAPLVSPPRPPAGLDEQGYPPLIARSVQRTPASGRPSTTATPHRPADPTSPDAPPPAAEVPLSPFGTAITALQAMTDPPAETVTASATYGTERQPDLVVARRVAPDGAGELPPATGHLQPDASLLEGARGHGPAPVQRSLIGGRPSVPSALDALPTAAWIPTAPAVQRLRYDSAVSTGGPRVDGPVGPPEPPGASRFDAPSGADPAPAPLAPGGEWSRTVPVTGPSSAGAGSWSVQREAAGSGSDRGGPALQTARGDRPSPKLQSSVPLALGSAAPATSDFPTASGFPTTSVASAPPASAAPSIPASGAGELPLIQRRFDTTTPSSAAGTPLAPPASADPPTMAVSSRTVGLAEMFALAAAQSADGVAVQRSTEPEVQTASVDAAPAAPAPSSSAVPAGSGPAATLSGAELAEMARRLYEPLSARLRNELWQDRERAGLLTDLRP